jgi:lipoprotein-anchoring transpeptidase ErfK/SrfK
LIFAVFLVIHPGKILAQTMAQSSEQASSSPAGLNMPADDSKLKSTDSDGDGLSDYDETYIYHTDPSNPDTDGDGYNDGHEVEHGYDPNKNGNDKLQKEIDVDLATQTLTYFLGQYQVGQFLISSGVKGLPTPPGQYTILKKIPVVDYKGADYNYPNTKWNLMFKQQTKGSLYIHGAYWHHNFGRPMSHGCINVAYENMEPLYKWADIGTKVVISNEYKF